ncbi:MAG: hypothetical protein ACI81L_002299 [Verrucomicrobiales bacterium]|jgi:hypothetical protein
MLVESELRELIESARSHPLSDTPSRILVQLHMWRVAHLLDGMMSADASGLSELVALSFRPGVETGIYGLYYLTHPEESERFFVGGDKELQRIFKNHEIDIPFYGEGDKGPVTWDQAFLAAREALERPHVPLYLDDLKMYYSAFSSQHLHGGLGAVARYATIDGDAPAPNHRPEPILPSAVSIELVGLILGDLSEQYVKHE